MSPIFTAAEAHQFLVLRPDLPVIVPVAMIMVAGLMIFNLPLSFAIERGWIRKAPAPLKGVFCTVLILAMVTFLPDKNPPFIYFQF